MTPLDKLPKMIDKAQNEQEYILSTNFKFADKLNPHEIVDLCDNNEQERNEIKAAFVEDIKRGKDYKYLLILQILFCDNKITSTEYINERNKFLTNN